MCSIVTNVEPEPVSTGSLFYLMDNFTEIYDKYYSIVLCLCRSWVSREDAEDITAVVFVKLWKYRDKVPELKVKPFLFVCALNEIRDMAKKKKRYNKYIGLYAANEPDIVLPPESAYDAGIVSQLIRSALQSLNKKPRRILELSLEGFAAREIARTVGTRQHNVAVQRSAAYKILRENFHLPANL